MHFNDTTADIVYYKNYKYSYFNHTLVIFTSIKNDMFFIMYSWRILNRPYRGPLVLSHILLSYVNVICEDMS